jgi:hypothetical protein
MTINVVVVVVVIVIIIIIINWGVKRKSYVKLHIQGGSNMTGTICV